VGGTCFDKLKTCVMVPGIFWSQALAKTFGQLFACFLDSVTTVVQKDLSDGFRISHLFFIFYVQGEWFGVIDLLQVHDCWSESFALLQVLK
jgi:hypothetical protein